MCRHPENGGQEALAGNAMVDDIQKGPDTMLPMRQRIAWIAAIWFVSVAAMAAASWLVKLLVLS